MMISEKHKSIWLVPQGCESGCINKILENFDFHNFDAKINDYSGYTIISSIKNPYFILYELYKEQNLKNIVIKKNSLDNIIKNFNVWINLKFTNKKFLIECDLNFENITPNHFVRIENLLDDFKKIEFLNNFELNCSDNNEYYFDGLYKIDSAKKVFEYFKKYFYLAGYNPFSFNQGQLSDSEKIRFIHDIF